MAKTYPRQVRVYLSEEEFQNLEAFCKQRDWSRSKGSRELFSKALNAEQRGRGSRALPGELNRAPASTEPVRVTNEQLDGLIPASVRPSKDMLYGVEGKDAPFDHAGNHVPVDSLGRHTTYGPPAEPSSYGAGFDHWSAANRHHGAARPGTLFGEAI